ncbi:MULTISPECIES: FAD-dependent oxidoreductase [unclassified Neorhizobium]|uniref:FAD-dependent oxidoreductase n=1 Tax=unclassified Neorhizobium TaxID=2629175 RepID=UPI001FF2F40F|nr:MULTISPECIES: FAD-dependent oxidoreductase [unclassified Neorhizobium]MCJ9670995.1 FAD-dependent oxidoreductase [Neorhizobium sp. SHOUNA12B]MCJ9744166.1 FAD-dependent oxidoreductase [Neorhizobium sp. SHOUNA12A]
MHTDILVVGGGLGGVAAALGACRAGRSVIMTEEFDWIGGQLTSQAVPSDEHTWVEQFGITRSYRKLREGIRRYYRDHYPLTEGARAWGDLNPGSGWVSRICAEPRVSLAVMEAMLAPYRGAGKLKVLQPYRPVAADVDGDTVRSVTVRHRDTGREITISAAYILDATELGDLLPMTGTEYVKGFEAQSDTGEPSAPPQAQPDNVQAVSICFAIDHVDGDQTIDKPENYDYWRTYQPHFWGGPLLGFTAPHPRTLDFTTRSFAPNPNDDPLAVDADQRKGGGDENLWIFRRIAARNNFVPGAYASDICLVNWPMIDYMEGTIIDLSEEDKAKQLKSAADLSYSLFYWLQTEAPRVDGGQGFPGLRLRGDITGTEHGLAMAPYIRESRRIRPVTRIVEQDLSYSVRGEKGAVNYRDSIGIGMYRIDLHPSTGGDNYIDVPSCPFEIPLGALLPERVKNLIPAGKNIGTTHITNGCYRLHPVEWNIGEVAGMLAAHCLDKNLTPHQVQESDEKLQNFQRELSREGIEMRWPDIAAY